LCHAAFDPPVRQQPVNSFSAEADFTIRDGLHTRQRAQKRRFPGSVLTNQGNNLACPHFQAYTPEHLNAAVGTMKV